MIPPATTLLDIAGPLRACIQWDDVEPSAQDDALALQTALLPALERWDHAMANHAELEAAASNTYHRVVGRKISLRHIRRLIQRTIERDNWRRDWFRPEIFLRSNPPWRAQHRSDLAADEQPFAPLFDIVRKVTAGKLSAEAV